MNAGELTHPPTQPPLHCNNGAAPHKPPWVSPNCIPHHHTPPPPPQPLPVPIHATTSQQHMGAPKLTAHPLSLSLRTPVGPVGPPAAPPTNCFQEPPSIHPTKRALGGLWGWPPMFLDMSDSPVRSDRTYSVHPVLYFTCAHCLVGVEGVDPSGPPQTPGAK